MGTVDKKKRPYSPHRNATNIGIFLVYCKLLTALKSINILITNGRKVTSNQSFGLGLVRQRMDNFLKFWRYNIFKVPVHFHAFAQAIGLLYHGNELIQMSKYKLLAFHFIGDTQKIVFLLQRKAYVVSQ